MQKWRYGFVNLDKEFILAVLTFVFTLASCLFRHKLSTARAPCILLINAKTLRLLQSWCTDCRCHNLLKLKPYQLST